MKPRKTLQQMASEASDSEPKQIAGKPAASCPYCGAGMFVNGTKRGDSDSVKFQNVVCRVCKKSFKAKTKVESVILYEIGEGDIPSSSGQPNLTLIRESA
jgi:hypothetical protein